MRQAGTKFGPLNMAKGWGLGLLALVLWVCGLEHALAQMPSQHLTILYTNNVNGEIEPCPS